MTLVRVAPHLEQDVDLSKTYDAVVVGSGAAGGMAAHVLTTRGLKVLMLEAGKKLPIEQELRSIDRKSTRLNSSHSQISYAVFCLKKKKNYKKNYHQSQ